MSFGGFDSGQGAGPVSDINVTPLVDVMLVLLVIFIVTAPMLTHAIRIDLPQAASTVNHEKPQTVTLAIDGLDQLYWNDEEIGEAALATRLAEAAVQQPQPELHLRADRATRYERIAQVMGAARVAGVAKMGFVASPEEGAGTTP